MFPSRRIQHTAPNPLQPLHSSLRQAVLDDLQAIYNASQGHSSTGPRRMRSGLRGLS